MAMASTTLSLEDITMVFASGVYGSIPNAYVIFGRAAEFDPIEIIDEFFFGATSSGFRIFG